MLVIRPLDRDDLDEVAALVAREHNDARNRRPLIPAAFRDPRTCHKVLMDLLANGFVGVVAFDGEHCVGVMCGRTVEGVGFVPFHARRLARRAEDVCRSGQHDARISRIRSLLPFSRAHLERALPILPPLWAR